VHPSRYGGSTVLGTGGFSVGKLITFQLYWNMIRGNYEAVNNLIVQFTTARGAAQVLLHSHNNAHSTPY
jgi:hypothetical protein